MAFTIEFDVLEELAWAINGKAKPSYGGRYSYGGTCVSIVFDRFGELLKLGAAIRDANLDKGLEDVLLSCASVDNIGSRTIVYWNSVKCDDAPEVDDWDD